jgi:hypothetical protein
VAIPVGFGCGLWALLYRYDFGLPLLPTLIFGLLLTGLVYHQYQMHQWWIHFNNQPPIVAPTTSDAD